MITQKVFLGWAGLVIEQFLSIILQYEYICRYQRTVGTKKMNPRRSVYKDQRTQL